MPSSPPPATAVSQSLVHCIMLVNLLRLLGAIKIKMASHQIVTHPTQVALPLSPNHGLFGNNGLCCALSACRGIHPSFCALYHHLGKCEWGSRGAGVAHALVLGARGGQITLGFVGGDGDGVVARKTTCARVWGDSEGIVCTFG